jgi:protein required for attachment to host cells
MVTPREISWIVVLDAARARIFRSELPLRAGGPLACMDTAPLLELEAAEARTRSAALASDRPGRAFRAAGGHRRSAMAWPSEPQAVEKLRFLRRIAARLSQARRRGEYDRLVVVAPPRALGQLRRLLPAAVRDALLAEVERDLAGLPAAELADRLGELLPQGPAVRP